MRWKLTCFVLFRLDGHAPPSSLCAEECVSQHFFFLMSPMWSVVLSVTHPPPPPSLWTPSITCPSERVAWQWCDGATQTVKMDCYLGRHAHKHTTNVWRTNIQTESHMHAFTRIHTHNRTHAWQYNLRFCCTHTRSSELLGLSAEGRSIWHSVPAGNRPREASCFHCLHSDIKHTHTPEPFPLHLPHTVIQTRYCDHMLSRPFIAN